MRLSLCWNSEISECSEVSEVSESVVLLWGEGDESGGLFVEMVLF